MTPITPYPALPGVYRSSNGMWSFSLEEDGDIEEAGLAIAAWIEWRDFLVAREATADQDTLF